MCGRAGVHVIHDHDYLLLKEDQKDKSQQILVLMSSSANNAATTQVSLLLHCPTISGDTSAADGMF
jgi:hypothetical protein